MNDERRINPSLVHSIATGYMGSCVLLAALDLNVCDTLAEKTMTSREIADVLGLDPKPTERLLVALTTLKLLDRTEGTYSTTPESERYLVKSSPSYFGDYYRFEVRHCLMPDFIRLDELIRENRAIMSDDWAEYMADPEKARMFSLGQHSASLGGGRMLASIFDFPLQAQFCGLDPLVGHQLRLIPDNRLLDLSQHLLKQFFEILSRYNPAAQAK